MGEPTTEEIRKQLKQQRLRRFGVAVSPRDVIAEAVKSFKCPFCETIHIPNGCHGDRIPKSKTVARSYHPKLCAHGKLANENDPSSLEYCVDCDREPASTSSTCSKCKVSLGHHNQCGTCVNCRKVCPDCGGLKACAATRCKPCWQKIQSKPFSKSKPCAHQHPSEAGQPCPRCDSEPAE